MRVLAKCVAVLLVAFAAFLVYAVIHAASSAGGANVPVCIGYVVGAVLLTLAAITLWRGRLRGAARNAA